MTETHRLVTSVILIPVLLSLWSFGSTSRLGHYNLWRRSRHKIFKRQALHSANVSRENPEEKVFLVHAACK